MSGNLKRPERREQVLGAALRVFARTGYYGSSTADIAREAGISQGYVLHLFDTKEQLFLAALERAGEVILAQMRGIGLDSFELGRFTERYGRTMLEETVLLVLLQSFATANVPAVGAYVRGLLAEMYRVLVDRTGATPEEARDYMARALFLNAVLAMGFREHVGDHPWIEPLITATLSDPPPFIEPTPLAGGDGESPESR
ncbi:MAG TPA: TetR/AcrR family transcriptional regulator [Protaetiibacter sp.]|nr:TetR/AcrR family transcriptional regulator [Protaetiibacter sp.]